METVSVERPAVRIRRLREEADLPRYATPGAAGLDLGAGLGAEIILEPGEIARVPTGLSISLPVGYVGLIWDRGSTTRRGLHTLAGVLDWDFRGELMVVTRNMTGLPVTIRPGERIAQLVVVPCPQLPVVEAEGLDETERGERAFGSTGL